MMSPIRLSAALGAQFLALGAVVLIALGAPARAEDTLARIKQEGTTTVGTEAAFPPFEFVKDGKIVGYGKDILDYVIASLGVKLNQLDVPYDGLFPGLLAGKFDFIATTLSENPINTKKFAFTYPIAEGSTSLMKRKGDARVKSASDLSGLTVGTQIGTPAAIRLRDLDAQFKSAGKPGMDLKFFNSTPEGVLALANSQIDVVVSLLPTLKAAEAKQPGLYEVVGLLRPDLHEYLGWAMRPEDTALRDAVSAPIKALRDSGKLYELQDKWFGFRMELPESGYLPPGAI
jgi:polar amino acid transport system substrate-binding protein